MSNTTEYLGDGLYAYFDGFRIELYAYAHNGSGKTNSVYLEPTTYAALLKYVARLDDGDGSET